MDPPSSLSRDTCHHCVLQCRHGLFCSGFDPNLRRRIRHRFIDIILTSRVRYPTSNSCKYSAVSLNIERKEIQTDRYVLSFTIFWILVYKSVFIGASFGSIISFLLGRYLFRNCVLQLASTYPLFQAIDIALSENGLKIMVLLRLSPLIPFNALDYISGITSISLRDYTLALMAILPGAFVLCFAGASASSFTPEPSDNNNKDGDSSSSTVKIITIVTGLFFGGAGVYLGSYYSKMELDRVSYISARCCRCVCTLFEH